MGANVYMGLIFIMGANVYSLVLFAGRRDLADVRAPAAGPLFGRQTRRIVHFRSPAAVAATDV